jgi:predicted phosphate transport protein (TIGR00153 family)
MKSYFSGIFGSSPIKPLQRHMEKVLDCTRELVPLFQAVSRSDYNTVAQVQERISQLEDEADAIKKDLRLHLPSTLFLPVDRRDLLELLRVQDKVANKAKDIAGLILGRQMAIPASMADPFEAYVGRCVDAVAQALRAVEEMDELVETGFRGTEADLVHGILNELDAVEKDTDRMQVSLRATLRGQESELPPVDVMFLYKIIEWTGDLADLAQRVGSRLQLMLAK